MKQMKELRLATGRSMRETARLLGIPYTTYVNYEKGAREPNRDMLILLAEYFGVTVDCLIGHTEAPASSFDGSLSQTSQTDRSPLGVPLVGDIACGAPIWAEEHIRDYVPAPPFADADFCLVCHGDSMTGARICDGDLVYIKAQSTVENGQIAAVLMDDEATLKRVYLHGDALILQPENPAYQPMILRGEDMERVRILGCAVWLSSRIQ